VLYHLRTIVVVVDTVEWVHRYVRITKNGGLNEHQRRWQWKFLVDVYKRFGWMVGDEGKADLVNLEWKKGKANATEKT
jgi:hypothetical protein